MNHHRKVFFLLITSVTLLSILGMSIMGSGSHPLQDVKDGDWVEYNYKSAQDSTALSNIKTSKKWWTVSHRTETHVRVDFELIAFGARRRGGSHMFSLSKPFEPTLKDNPSAQVKVLSEGNETLTMNGKKYNCQWRLREIYVPLDKDSVIPEYKCKSRIWVCPEVPVGGIVKMENTISQRFSENEEFLKSVELYELNTFGRANSR